MQNITSTPGPYIFEQNQIDHHYPRLLQEKLYNYSDDGNVTGLAITREMVFYSVEMDPKLRLAFFGFLVIISMYYGLTAVYQYCQYPYKVVKYIKYCNSKSDGTDL